MPLERFRTFEDARRALWVERGDPTLWPRIRALWAFARRLAPAPPPRGLRRFRTIEDASRERDAWRRGGPGSGDPVEEPGPEPGR